MIPFNDGHLPNDYKFIDFIDSYISLVDFLRPVPYPGLKSIFLYTTYGENAFQSDINSLFDLFSPVQQDNMCGEKFLRFCISKNCVSFITFLNNILLDRLSKLDSIELPDQSSWVNTSKTRRAYYNPSPSLANKLSEVSRYYHQMLISRTPSPVNMRTLAQEVIYEVAHVRTNTGTVSPNPRCDKLIIDFLKDFTFVYDEIQDLHEFIIPLLKIYVNLTRLYFGAIGTGPEENNQLKQIIDIKNLQISDSTLAAVPFALLPMIDIFSDNKGSISNKGITYLSWF